MWIKDKAGKTLYSDEERFYFIIYLAVWFIQLLSFQFSQVTFFNLKIKDETSSWIISWWLTLLRVIWECEAKSQNNLVYIWWRYFGKGILYLHAYVSTYFKTNKLIVTLYAVINKYRVGKGKLYIHAN